MNITELKGIGAKTAENFNRLSVYTVSDLVGLYPRDYDVYHEPVFVKDISHESEQLLKDRYAKARIYMGAAGLRY